MYDPNRPESIFEGNNLITYTAGLTNAYKLMHGLGGDRTRPDVRVCAEEILRAEMEITLGK